VVFDMNLCSYCQIINEASTSFFSLTLYLLQCPRLV
jgi:hypothetical protein